VDSKLSAAAVAGWMRPDTAEADAPSPDHAELLRRMARDLDRFHRDPAQLRQSRPPGLADRPTVLPASIEQRLDELLHRVAALEQALGQGEATVVAEALDPLRTLLEVLTGEVTRLRRATGPDPEVAAPRAAEAGAMPPFPPLPQPVAPAASAAPTPGTGTLPQSAPPPDRPAPRPGAWIRPEPPASPAERSALIPIAVMAIPVLLLATVFMDRVPTQAPAAIHRPAPSRSPPHPAAVVATSPHPVAPPPAFVHTAAVVPDHHPPAARLPAATLPAPATLPALVAQDRAAAPPHRPVASAPTPSVISPPTHAPAPPVPAAMQPGAVTVVGPDISGSAAGSPHVPVITAPLAGEGSAVPLPPIHPAAPPIPTPHPAPAAIHPAAAPPSAPAASPKPSLAIRTTADAWISVIDAKGTPVFSRLMHAGDSWTPPGPGLLLTTGNAGGTELVVNGIPGPPLGAPGAVVHGVPLGVMHAPKPSHAP